MNEEIIKKSILELLGLKDLPEDKQKSLIDEMSGVVQSRIARRIDAMLSEQQKQEFNRLTETGANEEAINQFLKKHVPNLDEIAAEEVLTFKQDMVNEAETLRKALE